jgi:hypothetical protein
MSWWTGGPDGVTLSRGGWNFFSPGCDARLSEKQREKLFESALSAVGGTLSRRIRRSRHAETWLEPFGESHDSDVYFKVLDPITRVRSIFKRKRIAHVASISEHLRVDGFGVPEILLLGSEQRGGRELIVTARVRGFNAVRQFKRASLSDRRVMLHALGAEVARLHRAGYIHGDLTPYNVFVTGLQPPQFVFIDHERTRRTILSRLARPRMRNLVQLGHLELAGVTNADRMRVWCGYFGAFGKKDRRAERSRAAAMLRARIAQDRKSVIPKQVAASLPARGQVSGS